MSTSAKPIVLLFVLGSLTMPGAAAIESWCVEGACANYENESWGETDCNEPSPDYYGYRGYSVTYDDETSTTGAYVYQYCWATDDGENVGRGEALSVAVSRLDWTTFGSDGAFVYWESYEWNGESGCTTMLHTHAPAGPGIFEPLGCPAGDAPPMVLPPFPTLP